MNVSLTPKLEAMIRGKVESGMYNNASEVVREALRLLEERELQLARLRAELAIGHEQHLRGESVPFNAELMAQLKREAAEEVLNDTPVDDVLTP